MHDLDGSDVLSIMTAALRKLQGWSERAWLEEMSRFLRQPPPEPEHLTFLRRLFSPTHPCPTSPPPATPLSITIPPSSRRVEWLWKGGMPTAATLGVGANGKKSTSKEAAGQHATMRCKVEEDPLPAALPPSGAMEGDGESGEGGLWEGSTKLDEGPREHHKERNEALSVSRQRSVTPNTALRMGIGLPPSTATCTAVSRSHSLAGSPHNDSSFVADAALSTSAGTNDLSGELSDLSAAESGEAEGFEDEEDGEGYEDEEEEEEEEDEDEGYDDDEVHPLSQTIDALDLGL
ncbi:hypothetical protein BCR35DRAFT_60819 [Leucosporidium creatinivorum]|uniref:Uncharacterized protein n=1 Tax=Leucosporidium creatinivorum TaxID=106004 RepID=A0A1Y2FJF9_9BASI|nr:hypothetical protein BCR35DRAFT_60819 [Leucosporidium creatinivorum]